MANKKHNCGCIEDFCACRRCFSVAAVRSEMVSLMRSLCSHRRIFKLRWVFWCSLIFLEEKQNICGRIRLQNILSGVFSAALQWSIVRLRKSVDGLNDFHLEVLRRLGAVLRDFFCFGRCSACCMRFDGTHRAPPILLQKVCHSWSSCSNGEFTPWRPTDLEGALSYSVEGKIIWTEIFLWHAHIQVA